MAALGSFITEAPAIVGEVVGALDTVAAEAGLGNSVVSNAIKGAALTAAKGAVNPTVNAVFGKGTAEKVEANVYKSYSNVQGFINDMNNGAPFGTTYKQNTRAQKKGLVGQNNTAVQNNPTNITNTTNYLVDIITKANQDQSQGQGSKNGPKAIKTSDDLIGTKYSVNNQIVKLGLRMPK